MSDATGVSSVTGSNSVILNEAFWGI